MVAVLWGTAASWAKHTLSHAREEEDARAALPVPGLPVLMAQRAQAQQLHLQQSRLLLRDCQAAELVSESHNSAGNAAILDALQGVAQGATDRVAPTHQQ